jgi:hypothetical protein
VSANQVSTVMTEHARSANRRAIHGPQGSATRGKPGHEGPCVPADTPSRGPILCNLTVAPCKPVAVTGRATHGPVTVARSGHQRARAAFGSAAGSRRFGHHGRLSMLFQTDGVGTRVDRGQVGMAGRFQGVRA